MSGEQFALAGAIERLREIRRTPADGRCLVISAADPLNLAGIVTAGDGCAPSPRRASRIATACRSQQWKATMCDH